MTRTRTTVFSVLQRQIQSLEAQLIASAQRYDALVQEMLTLKRDGFLPYQPGPSPPAPTSPALPGPIERAILARAPEGTPEYLDLLRFARREMAWNADPETIAERILAGSAEEIPVDL